MSGDISLSAFETRMVSFKLNEISLEVGFSFASQLFMQVKVDEEVKKMTQAVPLTDGKVCFLDELLLEVEVIFNTTSAIYLPLQISLLLYAALDRDPAHPRFIGIYSFNIADIEQIALLGSPNQLQSILLSKDLQYCQHRNHISFQIAILNVKVLDKIIPKHQIQHSNQSVPNEQLKELLFENQKLKSENMHYSNKIIFIQNNYIQKQKQAFFVNQENQKNNIVITSLQNQVQMRKNNQQQISNTNQKLKEQNNKLNSTIKYLQQYIINKQNSEFEIQQKMRMINDQNERLNFIIEQKQNQLTIKQNEYKQIQQKLIIQQKQIIELQIAYKQLQQETEQNNHEQYKMQQMVQSLSSQNAILKKSNVQINKLTDQQKQLNIQLQELNNKNNLFISKIKQLSICIEKNKTHTYQLQQEIRSLQTQNSKLLLAFKEATNQIQKKQKKNVQAQRQIQILYQQNSNTQSQIHKLQYQLSNKINNYIKLQQKFIELNDQNVKLNMIINKYQDQNYNESELKRLKVQISFLEKDIQQHQTLILENQTFFQNQILLMQNNHKKKIQQMLKTKNQRNQNFLQQQNRIKLLSTKINQKQMQINELRNYIQLLQEDCQKTAKKKQSENNLFKQNIQLNKLVQLFRNETKNYLQKNTNLAQEVSNLKSKLEQRKYMNNHSSQNQLIKRLDKLQKQIEQQKLLKSELQLQNLLLNDQIKQFSQNKSHQQFQCNNFSQNSYQNELKDMVKKQTALIQRLQNQKQNYFINKKKLQEEVNQKKVIIDFMTSEIQSKKEQIQQLIMENVNCKKSISEIDLKKNILAKKFQQMKVSFKKVFLSLANHQKTLDIFAQKEPIKQIKYKYQSHDSIQIPASFSNDLQVSSKNKITKQYYSLSSFFHQKITSLSEIQRKPTVEIKFIEEFKKQKQNINVQIKNKKMTINTIQSILIATIKKQLKINKTFQWNDKGKEKQETASQTQNIQIEFNNSGKEEVSCQTEQSKKVHKTTETRDNDKEEGSCQTKQNKKVHKTTETNNNGKEEVSCQTEQNNPVQKIEKKENILKRVVEQMKELFERRKEESIELGLKIYDARGCKSRYLGRRIISQKVYEISMQLQKAKLHIMTTNLPLDSKLNLIGLLKPTQILADQIINGAVQLDDQSQEYDAISKEDDFSNPPDLQINIDDQDHHQLN